MRFTCLSNDDKFASTLLLCKMIYIDDFKSYCAIHETEVMIHRSMSKTIASCSSIHYDCVVKIFDDMSFHVMENKNNNNSRKTIESYLLLSRLGIESTSKLRIVVGVETLLFLLIDFLLEVCVFMIRISSIYLLKSLTNTYFH